MPDIKKRFLNFRELQEYTNLPVGTLRQYIAERRLPYYRPGRILLFKTDEVDAWLQSCRYPTVQERIDNDPDFLELKK
jgi:excisionase family DNA binding protein